MTTIRIEYTPDLTPARALVAAQGVGVVVSHSAYIGEIPTVWGSIADEDLTEACDSLDADDRVTEYRCTGAA